MKQTKPLRFSLILNLINRSFGLWQFSSTFRYSANKNANFFLYLMKSSEQYKFCTTEHLPLIVCLISYCNQLIIQFQICGTMHPL